MTFRWVRESPAYWDASKADIVGAVPDGVLDPRLGARADGEILPGTWWRVEAGDQAVGYGIMDVIWGDAEVVLVTHPEHQGRGVGSFILTQLEAEARAQGLNYLTNVVRPTHPDGEQVTRWLTRRGFEAAPDGRLLRAVPHHP